MSERDYLASKSLFRAGRSAAKVGRTARKTAEVTGANADEVTRAFRNSLVDVDQSVIRASGQARKVALVGGAALAGGLSVPIAVHHTAAVLREREKERLKRKSKRVVVKAMSPNKLKGLRTAANRSPSGGMTVRRDGEYARNRLSAYYVGAKSPVGGASPGVQSAFRQRAKSSASSTKYAAANLGAGSRLFSPVPAMGNSAFPQSVAARKLRMGSDFRSRPVSKLSLP